MTKTQSKSPELVPKSDYAAISESLRLAKIEIEMLREQRNEYVKYSYAGQGTYGNEIEENCTRLDAVIQEALTKKDEG